MCSSDYTAVAYENTHGKGRHDPSTRVLADTWHDRELQGHRN